ncbi:MAG TPA: hypothetical protein PKA64_25115, partial [Myxococcota bacterium]|nr:hypothetical protein [Myxococcota bacterium]
MGGEVKLMPAIKKMISPLSASPAPEAAGSSGPLQDMLKDPLQAKAPPMPGAETATDAAAGKQIASGDKVLRTFFLDAVGHVPWGQVEHLLGIQEPIAKGVRDAFHAQIAANVLDQPFVEVILVNGDLAIQVEDQEIIVAGPTTIVPGYAGQDKEPSPVALASAQDDARELLGEAVDTRRSVDREVEGLQADVQHTEARVAGRRKGADHDPEGDQGTLKSAENRVGSLHKRVSGLRDKAKALRSQLGGDGARAANEVDAEVAQAERRLAEAMKLLERLRAALTAHSPEAKKAEKTPDAPA